MSNITPLRPAMTAIAAVIALSSTPLLAQAVDGATGATPVMVMRAPTFVAPTVAQSGPSVSVAPVTPEAAPATQPVMRTMSTPVIHTEDAPAVSQAAPQHAAPIRHSHVTVAKAAPVETDDVKAKPIETAAPLAATPIPSAPVAVAAAPANRAPVAKTAAVQTTSTQSIANEVVPIAIGLGLMALGGGAFAFSRRKRREDEDEPVLEPTPVEAATVVAAKKIRVPKAAAPIADSKVLPSGFDISRFGRHTQAAYRGPTERNPSRSLKRRLSRASFFDQREREAALARAPVTTARGASVAATKAKSERDREQVTVRLAPQRKSRSFGYVFQK